MKRSDIQNMPAGKEINDLVAENVMGWHKGIYISSVLGKTFQGSSEDWLDAEDRYIHAIAPDDDGYEDDEDFHLIYWHPSESILWAWEVIEKMMEIKPILNYDPYSKKWYMRFNGGEFCSADTAELAICRTALLAVMEFEDE